MRHQSAGGVAAPLHVCFLFSASGMGGAERSMLRLIGGSHPHTLNCSVVLSGNENPSLCAEVLALGLPFHKLAPLDLPGLAQLLRQLRPDIVYMFGRIRTFGWALAARAAGVECLIGAERASSDGRIDWVGRKLDQRLLDGYIANSRMAQRAMVEWLGIPQQRVTVVYNGLAPDPRPLPAVGDADLGSPTIVCAANIEARKGQRVLLQAIRLLRPEYPAIRAVLVGRDYTAGQFSQQMEAEGLGDTYTWAGYTPDVRGYLARADIFALPSLRGEGVPTALLEAMFAGLPVVASDIGGTAELVRDGDTGLIVAPGDAALLAQRLRLLLEDATLRQALSARAQRYVEHHHTLQQMIAGHVAAFHQFLSAKSERAALRASR